MNTKIYNTIVQETYQIALDLDSVLRKHPSLSRIESAAMLVAAIHAPKGTYLPDIAIQVAFDVVGMSNDEKLLKRTFTERGSFVLVALENRFVNSDGKKAQNTYNQIFFIEGDFTQEKLDSQIALLALASGDKLTLIETLNYAA